MMVRVVFSNTVSTHPVCHGHQAEFDHLVASGEALGLTREPVRDPNARHRKPMPHSPRRRGT